MYPSKEADFLKEAVEDFTELKNELEEKLRKQMQKELANASLQVDIAAAAFCRAGGAKIAAGRLMGTKDYNTYKASIERGNAVLGEPAHEVHKDAENAPAETNWDADFDWIGDGTEPLLRVTYLGDTAEFEVVSVDGSLMFDSKTELWDDGYTKRNEAASGLDGVFFGNLYDQAVEFVKNNEG